MAAGIKSLAARAARSLTVRATRICAVCATLAAASPTVANAQIDADDRAYAFAVRWSVFPDFELATGELRYRETGERAYIMQMTARAILAVPRVDWRGLFGAEGVVERDGARVSQRFERITLRPGREETAIVNWDADGRPSTQLSRLPSGGAPLRARVPDEDVVDAIDPLTFVLLLLDRVVETNGESCDMAERTWDGARLAEISVTTGERVPAARVVCRVVYDSIVGLPDETRWRAREETTTRVIVFERRLGRWEPVSVRIDGEFAGFTSTFSTVLERIE